MKNNPCGFRFSSTDTFVLVLAATATMVAWNWLEQLALIFVVVALHFFLFCNVFRIPRVPELIWAGAFVVNVMAWFTFNRFSWPAVLGVQTPLTIALIAVAFIRNDYHGIGWRYAPHPRQMTPPPPAPRGVTP